MALDGVVRAGSGKVGDVTVRAGRLSRSWVRPFTASTPRQMVMGAADSVAGFPPSSSTLLVRSRPPPPLELMDDEVQMGVRGATTTLLTSKTSLPQGLPQVFTPPYIPPTP